MDNSILVGIKHNILPDPFGMITVGRNWEVGSGYRYGFNGKESDSETYGDGNIYDYGFRIYNPRLGKFLSDDPISKNYAWYTPYQFAGNKPIAAIDMDGLEEYIVIRIYENNELQSTTIMKVPDKEQIDGLNGSIYFELDASNPETGNQLQLLFGTPDAQVVDETKTNWSLIINKSGNSIIAGSYQDQSTNGDPNGLRPYERDIINFNDRNNKSLESPTDNPSTGSTGSQCRTPAEDRCIYFNNDESTLDHEDIDILAPALRALSETPSLSLSIEGNTDMNASSTYNQGLGTRRATSTSQYFEGEGISKDRISIRSNGETYAAQGSPSADQLASDRNAEIKVIYPQKGH